MKNKTLLLLKNNIVNSFKLKSNSKKKKILISFFAIYIISVLIFTFYTILNKMFITLKSFNLANNYIFILFNMASLFSFFFSVYSAKAGLFENRDNDLLLSLPLSKKTILLNRLLYITIYNFIIGLIFLIPGIYIYITNVEVTSLFYLFLFFMVIFFPLIPTILASLFGYLIAYLISKSRKRNLFEILYYLIFIFIYMFFMLYGNTILLKLISNINLVNRITMYLNYPMYLINKGLVNNNFIYILYFIFLNLTILFLFIHVLSKNYFKLISKLGSIDNIKHNKIKKTKVQNPIKALKNKEIKKYFSSPIYVFNTGFGVLLLLIVGICSIFYSSDKLIGILNLGEEINLTPFLLVLLVMLFIISMTNITSSSISIEKSNFWIIKSLPLKTKDIFKAKIFVNKIVLLPIAILSLGLFALNGYINFSSFVLLILITYFYNDFIANFGLLVNLKFPKLDALNDTYIVKQSISSMIGIMAPLFFLIFYFSLISTINNDLKICVITIIISIFLSITTKIVLKLWGEKRFKSIN